MIELIILFTILMICIIWMSRSINSKCVWDEKITIPQIIGTKIQGIGLASKLGFPTINLKINKPIPCGFYLAESEHGKVTLIVGKLDRFRADVHFHNYNEKLEKLPEFNFWNAVRLIDSRSEIITTYNDGCC